MDCRREANRRGLTIRGPKKIFDSSLANIGMLFAKRHGVFRNYHDRAFELFWKRELDIEDESTLSNLLSTCGAPGEAFPAFANADGRAELLDVQSNAEERGVFGVPSFLFEDGDLYWGREHLSRIQEILEHNNQSI